MHRVFFSLSQDIRIQTALRSKFPGDILEQTLTVCSGIDVVNINLCHFVFHTANEKQVKKQTNPFYDGPLKDKVCVELQKTSTKLVCSIL